MSADDQCDREMLRLAEALDEVDLEQKRLEFVEWQRTEHFSIDDVDYETVEKFIAECGDTMVPALVSAAVKAAVRVGCFQSDLAAMRFVATAIEEERAKQQIVSEGCLASPTHDGDWLFREDEGVWFRLTRVDGNKATGGWIAGESRVSRLEGEWREPTDEEKARASLDGMGRLLPREQP